MSYSSLEWYSPKIKMILGFVLKNIEEPEVEEEKQK